MKTELKALLFDVDGTLADTERDGHRVAFNAAFDEHGIGWHWDVELYGKLLAVTGGKERMKFYASEFLHNENLPANFEQLVPELHAAKTRHYTELLSTGAIQSNYMRTLAAAASKLGLESHIQLENRVPKESKEYNTSGNRLLTGVFGATIYTYPEGDDAEGADRFKEDRSMNKSAFALLLAIVVAGNTVTVILLMELRRPGSSSSVASLEDVHAAIDSLRREVGRLSAAPASRPSTGTTDSARTGNVDFTARLDELIKRLESLEVLNLQHPGRLP